MTAFSIGRSILVLSCIGGLAGCASTDDSSTGSAQGFQQAAAACLAATGRSEMMALHVPAADNPISGRMAVASLRMGGGSQSVTMLVSLLQKPSRGAILLSGPNQEMTAATAEVALRELPKGAGTSSPPLCVAVGQAAGAGLVAAGKQAGIQLVLVP